MKDDLGMVQLVKSEGYEQKKVTPSPLLGDRYLRQWEFTHENEHMLGMFLDESNFQSDPFWIILSSSKSTLLWQSVLLAASTLLNLFPHISRNYMQKEDPCRPPVCVKHHPRAPR